MLTDWYHDTSEKLLTIQNSLGIAPDCVQSILFNGKGQYIDTNCSNIKMKPEMENMLNGPYPEKYNIIDNSSLEIIEVEQNKNILLRFINSGSLIGLEITIDNHWMEIVEYVKNPQLVEKFIISPGQRYSVIIKTNKNLSSYWIRASRYATEDMMLQMIEGKAILRYKGYNGEVYSSNKKRIKQLDDKNLKPINNIIMATHNDIIYNFSIINYGDNIWTINGVPFEQPQTPAICKYYKSKTMFDINYGDYITNKP